MGSSGRKVQVEGAPEDLMMGKKGSGVVEGNVG
jgi:hypothetical protein